MTNKVNDAVKFAICIFVFRSGLSLIAAIASYLAS